MTLLLGTLFVGIGVLLVVYRASAAARALEWYVKLAGKTASEDPSAEARSRLRALRRASALFGAVCIVIGLSYWLGTG